jgi:hypothetical protein
LYGTRRVWASDDLLGEIQVMLAALADLECSYERERLRQKSITKAGGRQLRAKRENHHQQEREAYVQRLSQLEHQMRALTSCT